MKQGLILGYIAGMLMLAAGTAPAADGGLVIEAGTPPNPWTSLDIRNDAGPVRFAILSDRNGGNRPGIFPDAIAKINLLQPQFVMSIGDFITGYSEDRSFLNRDWDEVQAEIAKLEAPFFYTVGNHDIRNAIQAELWKKRFGRTYYHFRYRDLLFLVICTEDGKEWQIGDSQTAYFADAIAKNREARWTFIFQHKPMWVAQDQGNFRKIEAALTGMKYTVFAGHTHQYTKYVRNGMKYFMLGVTGGGINPDNASIGEFDQFVMVTVPAGEPRIANILLSGVVDEDVVVPAERDLDRQLHPPVQETALVTEAGQLDTIAMKWSARNESALPMVVTVDLGATGPFAVAKAPERSVVAPGTTGFIEAVLKAPAPVAVAGLPRIPYRWRIGATPEGRKERAFSGDGAIVVVQPAPAARAPQPVVVDGRLDEWGDLPQACLAPAGHPAAGLWQGPRDGSFRFAIRYDDKFVYAAVRMTDDSMVSVPRVNPWDQDGVNVGIQAWPARDWTPAAPSKWAYCFLSPAKRAKDSVIWGAEWMPKGFQAACVWSGDGYSAEIAFPVESLQEGPDRPWTALRVCANLYDFDRDAGEGTYFNWTPVWNLPESWAGSGAFVRK